MRIRIPIAWCRLRPRLQIATRPVASAAVRAPWTVGLLLVALLAGACSSGTPDVTVAGSLRNPSTSTPSSTTAAGPTTTTGGAGPGSSTATTMPAGTLDWKACGRLQCATLTVPLDYTDATKGTIDLNLKRHPASGSNPIGSLLVNPG